MAGKKEDLCWQINLDVGVKRYKGIVCGRTNTVGAGGRAGYSDVLIVGVRSDLAVGFYFKLPEMRNPDNCGLIDPYFVRSFSSNDGEVCSLVLTAKKNLAQELLQSLMIAIMADQNLSLLQSNSQPIFWLYESSIEDLC